MDCDPFAPHVESFNYFIDNLDAAVRDVEPEEFTHPDGAALRLEYTGASLGSPSLTKEGGGDAKTLQLFPVECRQRGKTYSGKLKCSYAMYVNDKNVGEFDRTIASVPIMVMSKLCSLNGLDGPGLIQRSEEETEKGGFFIVKGLDKILRLLILMRQNFPMALVRDSWQNRGPNFTHFGILIRCVKGNHTSFLHTLHYLTTRRIIFSFTLKKEQFFVPILYVLRALFDGTDKELYDDLLWGRERDDAWKCCIENMFQDVSSQQVFTQNDALKYLGHLFRIRLFAPVSLFDEDVGKRFLERYILIHLTELQEKYNFFIYSIHKLMALVRGECKEESTDNPIFQEVALPGHILLMLLKEKLKGNLRKVRYLISEQLIKDGPGTHLTPGMIENAFRRALGKEITHALVYFLATGNLPTNGDVVMPQTNGFSIVAERINHLRYISHFRGIHRGAAFQEMRTTDVRKLKPEAWGFLCPVHTPDGAPCGLLNHLAAACDVVCDDGPIKKIMEILSEYGIFESRQIFTLDNGSSWYPVLINGKVVGYLNDDDVEPCTKALRTSKMVTMGIEVDPMKGRLKVDLMQCLGSDVSPYTEIVLTPKTKFPNLFPSLYIFTNSSRMVRPVYNLGILNDVGQPRVEYIGIFEQIYLNIACLPEDFQNGLTTHQEISPSAMFSFVASLIPYPDHNQSPRNVYQCQMSKQTMGSIVHSLPCRVDNKLYRLQTPQSPLVKTSAYDRYEIDRYPLGTNAIIAVISYTGYDMEDAMVINKSSYDRGFAQGTVYKCERVNLTEIRGAAPDQFVFARDPNNQTLLEYMDADGLPYVGQEYADGDPFYCYMDVNMGTYKFKKYTHTERCHVDNIKVCGSDDGDAPLNHVVIMMRYTRKPNIGDKFASRHGQKGICSFLWPSENMPFTESGMVPDIIFNPHGFPSRMTVGMMIECMAGKSAAAHGLRHDATPFVFNEEFPAVDFFGKCLRRAGFNYLGEEPMYSGVDGREFQVQIFFGLVYYQRLRHMVADKFQVRATGSVDPVTWQPIKGRKMGGGVRFGEMERDSLISHGAAAMIHERLFSSSDRDTAHVCAKCGCYLSIMLQVPESYEREVKKEENGLDGTENGENGDGDIDEGNIVQEAKIPFCRTCRSSQHVKIIPLPHAFKYLMAELVSVGVKVVFSVK